nr:MAG TPA: hypothetical protein [Caudoviricetes sp.]
MKPIHSFYEIITTPNYSFSSSKWHSFNLTLPLEKVLKMTFIRTLIKF